MKKGLKIISGVSFAFIMVMSVLFGFSTDSMIQPVSVSANDITGHLPATGEVNGSGVYGYTSNYVLYDGAQEVQHAVQDGWHITMKNAYYSHGVQWLECWDTDDGDYYGWIDISYITIYSSSYNEPQQVIDSYSITPRKAEVDGNGVYGYTSNYVLYGGSQETQHKVQDGWHITAYNTAYSHGVDWYECWDTDDGDYYGWIDARYIDFYDERPPKQTTTAATTTQPVRTVISEKTVIVTVTVTITQEAAVTDTTTETALFAAEIVTNDENGNKSESGIDSQMLIIIIAIIIVIIIAISALLIVLITKKGKVVTAVPDMSSVKAFNNRGNNISTQIEGDLFCVNCGAARSSPDDVFCPNCGTPYNNQ